MCAVRAHANEYDRMKKISLYIDLAVCLVVLPLIALIFPVERWVHHFPWYVASVGIWIYLLYALNRTLTVPWLFGDSKRRMISAGVIVASLAITYGLSCVRLYTPKPNIHDIGIIRVLPDVQPYQQAVWSLFMIAEAFSFAVGLLTETFIQRSRRRAVESQRDKAELAFYKAQIKPHFMFNTLNSLYGLFLTGHSSALPSLEKFISMMRYVYSTSKCDFISLEEEVDYIRQYVDLQTLRLNGMTTVSFQSDMDGFSVSHTTVPPMLLITFVENCFKHGISTEKSGLIEISLNLDGNGLLSFRTENPIVEHTATTPQTSSRMGIENCRRRLELLYPSRHSLSTKRCGDKYIVELTIQLDQ